MKTYADLDLKKIRDDCGLDFARHTYSQGQCSCCYGPQDMGEEWWVKGKKPQKIVAKRDAAGKSVSYTWDRDIDKYTYILFKNADNGSGRIKSLKEPVKNHTFVEHRVSSNEQLEKVCQMLQEQLGAMYYVEMPEDQNFCIDIYYGTIFTVSEVLEMVRLRDHDLRKGSWFYFDDVKGRMEPVTFDASLRKAKCSQVIHFI